VALYIANCAIARGEYYRAGLSEDTTVFTVPIVCD
jgi:hypothetical protein